MNKLQQLSMKTLLCMLAGLPLLGATDDQIANAIYRLEGGTRAKAPYGILSIKVRDAAHARRICLNTIRNNRVRWKKYGQPGAYLDYLADKYCPRSADPIGNKNWKVNIHKLINE